MRSRNFIVPALLLIGCVHLYGQEFRKEISVDFRVGKGTLDTAYADNAARLSELVSFIDTIRKDTTLELIGVEFCGSASPEGSILINRRLAKERRLSIESYVRKHISLPDSIVTRCDGVIAWEKLAMLAEQSDMPYREEAVDVLRNVPEAVYDARGVLTDSRKKHLMELQYGRTWHYMDEHFFPYVRNAAVVFAVVRRKPEPPELPEQQEQDTVKQTLPVPEAEIPDAAAVQDTTAVQDTAVMPDTTAVQDTMAGPLTTASAESRSEKPFYMALKTNMLYDVLAVPNIGIEFYLGRNWSVSANWMYAWWNSDTKHRYWRLYGGEIAVRKWFGRRAAEKPLTGHHLGVYGQIFTYDFEWNGTGYMGGQPGRMLWNRPNYAAGIEYGYSLPIGRRLNIDFSVGLGYWGGEYYVYRPLDGHYVWEATRNRHWIGPTKAEIALVWLLGRGNVNNRKGGLE